MWNHRVIEHKNEQRETWYTIHEVYYNTKGEVVAYTEDPIYPFGDTIDDLKKDTERILGALDKVVLVAADIVFGKPDWED